MKKSPITVQMLNPITEKEAHSFFEAMQCERMFIAGKRDGVWGFQNCNISPFDQIELAKSLLESAMDDLV